jgi:hypothetical protein
MFAKPQRVTFIDDMVIEVHEAQKSPIMVTLRNEDGTICCKIEKKIRSGNESIKWEGLNDLPYGIYTLQCSQGDDVIETRMVKRI